MIEEDLPHEKSRRHVPPLNHPRIMLEPLIQLLEYVIPLPARALKNIAVP